MSFISARLASLKTAHDRARSLSRWVLACAAASAVSCASDLQPLNVTSYYPLTAADNNMCVPLVGTSLVKGIYDVNRRGAGGDYPGYVVGIAVKSDMDGNLVQPGKDTLRIPSNSAQLTSLTAKYTWSPAAKGTPAVTIPDATFPISALVSPSETDVFAAQILPGTKEVNAALTKGKSGTLTVEITMSGTLQNGGSVSSTPSFFSVGVCTDCIADCDPTTEVLSTPCGAAAAGQADGRVCTAKE